MAFYQLDTTRIIQVYIVQGIIGIFFLIMVFKVLKRDTKRLNLIASGFYLCIPIGVFINFIYAPLTDEMLVIYLYYITIFSFFYTPIFLVVLEAILLKSEKVINTPKQLLILIVYGLLLLGMVFIPNGVVINETTDWKPVWNMTFFIYTISIFTFFAIIPSLYLSLKIYQKFEEDNLKKKWQYFIIGIIGGYIVMYGTFISNVVNIQDFRVIWSIISLILILISPYLIYYGMGKELEAE